MKLKEGPLPHTEIESSLKYKSESEISTSSTLPLSPLLSSSILPILPHNMS